MASDHIDGTLAEFVGAEIAALVAADQRPAMIVVPADGSIVWASAGAEALLGAGAPLPAQLPAATPALSRLRELARSDAFGGIYQEKLRLFVGRRMESLASEMHLLALPSGMKAVLLRIGDQPIPGVVATSVVHHDAVPVADPVIYSSEPPVIAAPIRPAPMILSMGTKLSNMVETVPDEPASARLVQESHHRPADHDTMGFSPGAAHEAATEVLTEAVPVAAPAPASLATISTPLWMETPVSLRRPLRFVFQLDSDSRITALSPVFTQATGVLPQDLIGHRLDAAVARFDAIRGAHLSDLLETATTWSGVTVYWPVSGTDHLVPIDLSAMPVIDAGRQFLGFNGFGIARIDRAKVMERELEEPEEEAEEWASLEHHDTTEHPVSEVTDLKHSLLPESEPVQRTFSDADAAYATDIAAAEALDAVEQAEQESAELERQEDDEDSAEDEPQLPFFATSDEQHPISSLDDEAGEDEQDAAPLTDGTATHDVVERVEAILAEQETFQSGVIEPQKPASPTTIFDETPETSDGLLPVQTSDATESTKARLVQDHSSDSHLLAVPPSRVVNLQNIRAQIGASLGDQKVVPLNAPGAPVADAPQRLSHSERNAFREIAKALGARYEESESVAPSFEGEKAGKNTVVDLPPLLNGEKSADLSSKSLESPIVPSVAQEGEIRQEHSLGDILVERIPVGILVFRGDRPLFLNRPLLEMLGYDTLWQFIEMRGLDKLFRGRAAPSFANGEYDTVTIMKRDGQTIPVDAHLQAMDWNGQHATCVTFRRASDAEAGPRLRSIDAELKARQSDLNEARAILDTATDGVISLDDNGRILSLNRSAEALFGYDQNELTGERVTLLLAPESHAAALDYLDGLKANGVASVLNDGRDVMGRERKGGRIPLFMTIGRVSDAGNGKFAAVVRDLTAWKRAETELTEAKRAAERASALKSDFLAKVSHEIRTPMNAIIGFAEVMRDERLGPIGTERYKEYLKDIHTSGEHVISLVNDLLDLSKIEAGRMELDFGSVDINAVVSSCVGIMQPQTNRDRVILRSQLYNRLPPVVADERSIRQIVLNLLSNASKFTEPGGQVIISTALSEQGEAVIRVRDTGIGMSEQEIQAAMEPFRQLQSSRNRGGTGLGLPLTKALVEANRAAFNIRSKTREGTLVEVVFPATRVLAE